ncbi:hypothetical protein EVAR_46136_1 [Eumeta japonica]|uniref:Uncharacterized protein n=1 Tax=Eumeta variegata TaxID=151549 RepID=A0A4C1XTU7_EUMVA|nr:hypothetical protein EVAR_46136_1 [Eumeta japonica]
MSRRHLVLDDDAVMNAINDSDFGDDSEEDENWVPPGKSLIAHLTKTRRKTLRLLLQQHQLLEIPGLNGHFVGNPCQQLHLLCKRTNLYIVFKLKTKLKIGYGLFGP